MLRLLRFFAAGVLAAQSGTQHSTVLQVNLEGVIHPVTVDILDQAIRQAGRDGHAALLLRLNTPGGFLEATRAATEKLLSSPVPVIVWVGPSGARAASAGFFLLQAADVAAMAPGTNTGAAHPVMLAGAADPALMKKVENDAAASLRSVVERRGRNAAAAEKAVLESRSFTDREALAQSLIDVVAGDPADLFRQLGGREIRRFDGRTTRLHLPHARVVHYEPTISQRVQLALSDPNLALGAVLLGALLLYVEISTPGVILPGVAGAILLLLGLSALSVLPVTWTGAGLLALALVLFALEIKIVSHGVLGAGGLIAMALGATLLIDSPLPEMRIQPVAAIGMTLPFALILLFLVTLVVQARNRRVQTGVETFAGQVAQSLTEIAPEGKVLFHGEIWDAEASVPIGRDAPVRVVSVHGLKLQVEPVPPGQ